MGLTTNIITFSIIIILIYFIYKIMTRTVYSGSQLSASSPSTITCTTSPTCAYSMWIYIDTWSSAAKPIFSRGTFSLNIATDVNQLSLKNTPLLTNVLSKFQTYTLNDTTEYSTTSSAYYSSPENCEKLCSSSATCLGYNYYSDISSDSSAIQTNTLAPNNTHGCKLASATTTTAIVAPALYSKSKDTSTEILIDNAYIPLQEWVFITINVTTFYTEVYINGKLVRTIAFNGQETQPTGDVTLTPAPGFNGQTSDFKFSKTALSATQIWKNYRAGFGKYFSLSDYSIKIKFNEETD